MEDVFQGHFGEHDSASAISRLLLLMMSGMLSLQCSTLHYDAPPVDGGGTDLGRGRRGDGGHCDSLRGRSRSTLGHALLTARVESAAVTVSTSILIAAAGGRILLIWLLSVALESRLFFCHLGM